MSKTIEIFTDSSLYSGDLEERVKEYACSKCNILIHDVNNPDTRSKVQSKASKYGAVSLPAVVIDGKLHPLEKLNRGKFTGLIHRLFHK